MEGFGMYCMNCGKEIPDHSKFCEYCGSAVSAADLSQFPSQMRAENHYEQPQTYVGNGAVRNGIPAPGFSDRVNHPEILKSVKKGRRAAKIFLLFLVPVPVIGFAIYSIFSGEMELPKALLYGGIVSAVFLLFAIISLARSRAEKSYDATVIGKTTELTYRHKNTSDQEMITEYRTLIRTDSGKKRTIVEREGSRILAYTYMKEGDRFRYHPQFAFPYELYDKSVASGIYCVGCGTKNPVENDRCSRCGLPLLK